MHAFGSGAGKSLSEGLWPGYIERTLFNSMEFTMSKRHNYLPVAAICLLLLILAAGCSSSPYKSINLDPMDLFKEKGKNAVNSSAPSWETMQYLRLSFLDAEYKKDPVQLIDKLEIMSREQPSPQLRQAIAELALLQGQRVHRKDPKQAVMYYMMAAEQCYDYLYSDPRSLASSPLIPSYRFMADIYNLAIARGVATRSSVPGIWDTRDVDYEGLTYHFSVASQAKGIWDPRVFNYIYDSYELRVTGIQNEYITKGLGAPLVGIVEKPRTKPGFGRFYPPKMVSYPVSAVMVFGPVEKAAGVTSRTATLVFYDTLEQDAIEIQGRRIPLEADFTTPLGVQIRNNKPESLGLRNLFKSQDVNDVAALVMLEPYRADKIPVVMVHGLMSSPMTWVPLFNDLRGDPELRKRYQFWFFGYPTGLPIGYSASILRQQLNLVRATYDPNGTNPNFNQMVLVGHSMGGLLSRTMMQDSGTIAWDYYFKEPIDSIQLDPATKETLKPVLFFNHLPYVKRVIFIATPHKGSKMADEWYTKLAAGMVSLPDNVSNVAGNLVLRKSMRESVAEDWTKQTPNALILLSPSSNFIKMTNQIPLYQGIPYHSIIGTRYPTDKGEGTSDGTVEYWSSHLDFTESEKLVPSDHSAHSHPLAIAEVKRILREHLAKLPAAGPQAARTDTAPVILSGDKTDSGGAAWALQSTTRSK
jgi:pimeloyl-ACP methyl ester carboxylesterase